MKGKKFLLFVLMFSVLSAVALCGALSFSKQITELKFVSAESIDGFSARYDNDIIFSVEKVYFAENEADRGKELEYSGYEFNGIQNSKNETQYFGDAKLFTATDYSNKEVVQDGEYVKVADKSTKSAKDTSDKDTSDNDVIIKEGLMITLGGYYYDESGEITTNKSEEKEPGKFEDKGANLRAVAVQATRTGANGKEQVTDLAARTYNSTYYDFVWFLEANEQTEGFYELSISFMKSGGNWQSASFSFYLLLDSKYAGEQEINSNPYSIQPTMDYAEPTNKLNQYRFFSGANLQYPTLTFDYKRYNLSYTVTSLDETREVSFEYDSKNNQLLLTTSIYNNDTVRHYPITAKDNSIVSLMFVDAGEYQFKFEYVYYDGGNRLTIDNLSVEPMSLNIYGYQLKYSKAGFLSADMTYLELASNGTMLIVVNGYTDKDIADGQVKEGDSLGVYYGLVNDTQKTGTLISSNSLSPSISTEDADGNELELSKFTSTDISDIDFEETQTNQGGLWLTLNDEYFLKNADGSSASYYYYSLSPFSISDKKNLGSEPAKDKNGNVINDNDGNPKHKYKQEPFTKVTTFKETGYYLVQVKYTVTINGGEETKEQIFAFRITSATPKFEMFTTEESVYAENLADKTEFYSRQYTNKNVFAQWEDPKVFESRIVAKVYRSITNNKYPSEEELKAVADGRVNSNIGEYNYSKHDVLKDSGAYMIVLALDRTATKTYAYFKIDKEPISGLEIYEVNKVMLGTNLRYSIKRDANDLNKYITHTASSMIDVDFTIGWADKASGARIDATYTYTPFVKTTNEINEHPITQGNNSYLYITNGYSTGETSNAISISKPEDLKAYLIADNVITGQGIYVFSFKDQAGNTLSYIVIVDNTESVIKATYEEADGSIVNVLNGDKVASNVSVVWGTHKAIDFTAITEETNTTINNLIEGKMLEDYYTANGSNANNFAGLFTKVTKDQDTKKLFIIQNSKTQISLVADKNQNTYIITGSGEKQIKQPNGTTLVGWGGNSFANEILSNASNQGITIKVDSAELHNYIIGIVSKSQVSGEQNNTFSVSITPDEALGTVWSASSDLAVSYDTKVMTKDATPTNMEDNNLHNLGQASNDGLFVFEWQSDEKDDGKNVVEVKYDYYQLMSKSSLNEVTKDNIGRYYPYSYVATQYILETEETGTIKTEKYTTTQRGGKTVCQSNPLNVAYETYYNQDGTLVSNKVTQTGLYIITRTLENEGVWQYAFFVDRNRIISYSLGGNSEKIVGEFIHVNMQEGTPNFANFTRQGLSERELNSTDENAKTQYKVYLDTNKLPTKIKVPTGKYVSGTNYANIVATSKDNLNLRLSVYFVDIYNVLPEYAGATIRLMYDAKTDKYGYIEFNSANFDKTAEVTIYKKAQMHGEYHNLSLPGTYVFIIKDNVGHELEGLVPKDNNKFVFGVTLTTVEPQTDVYAYAVRNGKALSPTYSYDKELYTNQEYVDFDLPTVDDTSYDAQLDPNNFTIYRIENGTRSLWFEYIDGHANNNAIIKNVDAIRDWDETHNKYIIHLDARVTVDEDTNVITKYNEYKYEVIVRYFLDNSDEKYYTYTTADGRTSFYSSQYNITIDRTADADNLNKIIAEQESSIRGNIDYLARQNGITEYKINAPRAYRGTTSDYYALVNDLYYKFVDMGDYKSASESMYAIHVNKDTEFNRDNLSSVYYRKLNLNAPTSAQGRMSLLPICSTYFGNSSGFVVFNEASNEHAQFTTTESGGQAITPKYSNVFVKGGYEAGTFYEIVEKDKAGNLTQYVVYFESSAKSYIQITIEGNNHTQEGTSGTLTFGDKDNSRLTFIGITGVAFTGLASKGYPYSGNIKIYGTSDVLENIYINFTSNTGDIASKIENVIKNEGNYRIVYTDIKNNSQTVYLDNYKDDNYSLNIANLKVQTDAFGKEYIDISSLNNMIKENLYLYVTKVRFRFEHLGEEYTPVYNATFEGGKTNLELDGNAGEFITISQNDKGVLYLADNKQYRISLTDTFKKSYTVVISTSDNYIPYSISSDGNYYVNNNIYYTAGNVYITFDNTTYERGELSIFENGEDVDTPNSTYDSLDNQGNNTTVYTLKAKEIKQTTDLGALRKFTFSLVLIGTTNHAITYEVWIDNRTTEFELFNSNMQNKIAHAKSEIKTSGGDYLENDLRNDDLYGTLITETINVSWTRLTSDYFTYRYSLIEFESADVATNLLEGKVTNQATIAPKDKTTGKYVLKVEVRAKNNVWIATRVFTFRVSTTISGLYEVTDGEGTVYAYSSITNIEEIKRALNADSIKPGDLGFRDANEMSVAFSSFGEKTAIPMYMSINQLTLHSNKDNGVDCSVYTANVGNSIIDFYHIWSSHYRTFAIVMKVNNANGDILDSEQGFKVNFSNDQSINLFTEGGNTATVHNKDAEYYKLQFSSYNRWGQNSLEEHNKIIISVLYNGKEANTIIGGEDPLTEIEFKHGGVYTLVIKDRAGNVQKFGSNKNAPENFELTVMKEMLFTINNDAPIKYAFYDEPVKLTIINTNNYQYNSIRFNAYLNNSSSEYTGYVRNAYTYTFNDYGTYVVKMKANLQSTGEEVTSEIVFTILNPNEARTALDFTSICGYNIVSVMDITKNRPADVTEKFMSLLQDKSNAESKYTYNKLVSYQRVVEALKITTGGKVKLRVTYEVKDAQLLPTRVASFAFTLNNEVPSIESSIEAGGKTTKEVTLKINPAIIYSRIGDCNVVINDTVVLRIDETSKSETLTLTIKQVGKYYVKIVSDSGNVATSFNFTIKEPLNVMSVILIVVVSLIVIGIVGAFIWLRTRMKVR